MKSLTAILSAVQSDLGDITQESIQPAEYVDFVNDVLNEVASQTETWIAIYNTTPITTAPLTPVYSVYVPYYDKGALLSPYKLQRVIRSLNGYSTETMEYSVQSIESSQNTGYPFVSNSFQVGDYAFSAQRDGLDGFVISFATPISVNESITAEFIVGQPMLYGKWSPLNSTVSGTAVLQSASNSGANPIPSSVPDFLGNAMHYGILGKALQKLYMNGDDSKFQRMQWANTVYERSKKDAAYHSRMMKNNGSAVICQPINWLPE